MKFPATGKMSTFGGPNDNGIGLHEGLALVEMNDLAVWYWRHLFERVLPIGMGLGRSLNPDAYYCAMRWDYTQFSRDLIRSAMVKVTSKTATIFCRPVDFGPGDGSLVDGQPTPDTGRIIDLSPGAAAALQVETDDTVTVDLLLPEASS